jgi:hypothetical protein
LEKKRCEIQFLDANQSPLKARAGPQCRPAEAWDQAREPDFQQEAAKIHFWMVLPK